MSEEVPVQIKEIISRIRHLEIRAKKLVQDSLSSEYHSVFRGRGIEFNEVRTYQPGDDIRDIDWNVTARMNEPFIKTYIEERQLTVIFVVDVSASNAFGGTHTKRERMAEITALLGFSSFFNNDRAGLVLFSDEIEEFLPPRKNYSHLLRIIRDTWYFQPKRKTTSLHQTFNSIRNMLKKKTILFIISDFLDTGFEKSLMALTRKHEVIPIVVSDPLEEEFIPAGKLKGIISRLPLLADFEDLERGWIETVDLNLNRKTHLETYRNQYRKIFKKLGLDYAEIGRGEDDFKTVELLLRRRLHKNKG